MDIEENQEYDDYNDFDDYQNYNDNNEIEQSQSQEIIQWSFNDILVRQEQFIKELSERSGFNESTCERILTQSKWDLDKASNDIHQKCQFPPLIILENNIEYDCEICYDTFKGQDLYQFQCQHFLCKNCIRYLVQSKLNDAITENFNHNEECTHSIQSFDIEKILQDCDKKYSQLYQKFRVNSYIKSLQNIKPCPGADCDIYIQIKDKHISDFPFKNFQCNHKHDSCLKCGKNAHMPLNCDLLDDWNINFFGQNEKLNQTYLAIHTKQCPECKTNIQKNSGCMHMTCKICKYEFCWLCLGFWKSHNLEQTGGFYNCNKYVKKNDEVEKLNKQQKNLEKFTHYESRFRAHLQAMKLAQDKKKAKLQAMDNIFNLCRYYDDSKFMIEALDLIIECRRVIAYSYPVAYFLDKQSIEFFEFLQKDGKYIGQYDFTPCFLGFLAKKNLYQKKKGQQRPSKIQRQGESHRYRPAPILCHIPNSATEPSYYIYSRKQKPFLNFFQFFFQFQIFLNFLVELRLEQFDELTDRELDTFMKEQDEILILDFEQFQNWKQTIMDKQKILFVYYQKILDEFDQKPDQSDLKIDKKKSNSQKEVSQLVKRNSSLQIKKKLKQQDHLIQEWQCRQCTYINNVQHYPIKCEVCEGTR